ncbi:MAG: PH domain-containing protein [Muribaculaceae bacterium]|nr:PH domain-containing protein [Muribaculaceae bacterium]
MSTTVYKSKIDWWVWVVFLFMAGVTTAMALDSTWWVALSFGGTMLVCALLIAGCWYEIDGDQLVVYQFFKPNRFPIDKITEVKKTTGILATAGMSCHRVSIKFTDRSVMKSSMPLEISPKDRDGFMNQLKEVNPSIVIK